MKNVAVMGLMGLGNFGSTLACNWLVEGLDVCGWTREQEVYDGIQATGINEKYLDDVSLEGLKVSMDIAQSVADAEIVLLAFPSHFSLGTECC